MKTIPFGQSRAWPALLLLLGVPVMLGGCSTLGTTQPGEFGIYSGTKAASQTEARKWDVPLSMIADTILLPITVPLEIARRAGAAEQGSPSAPAPK